MFAYDIWANLLSIGGLSPDYNGCTQENLSVSVNAKNQISGNTYDAAGNMIFAPGMGSYAYDAENRMTAAAGVTYSYDGDGKRLGKDTDSDGILDKIYWYPSAGLRASGMSGLDALVETDAAGNNPTEYVFFGGKRIARRDPNGSVFYFFADHLGSSRVVTNATGTIVDESDFYPFGGERIVVNNDPNPYKFTGKERDGESGLDNFGARYYANTMGRFSSADPLFMELGRLRDPQRLNLYSYTRNNPLVYTDPTGMLVEVDCAKVSAEQCKQTVTDLNNRKDAQFQVTRDDKTGQLSVTGDVDPSKLSKSERALYDAITGQDHTATLEVRPFSDSIIGDQYVKPGLNILDRADLTEFGKANSVLPGEIIAHAAVEAYVGLAEGLGTYKGAHDRANQFFGDVRVLNLTTLPFGAATATSGQATYQFRRVGVDANVRKIFITPQPAASVPANWERIRGNLIVSTTDTKKKP